MSASINSESVMMVGLLICLLVILYVTLPLLISQPQPQASTNNNEKEVNTNSNTTPSINTTIQIPMMDSDSDSDTESTIMNRSIENISLSNKEEKNTLLSVDITKLLANQENEEKETKNKNTVTASGTGKIFIDQNIIEFAILIEPTNYEDSKVNEITMYNEVKLKAQRISSYLREVKAGNIKTSFRTNRYYDSKQRKYSHSYPVGNVSFEVKEINALNIQDKIVNAGGKINYTTFDANEEKKKSAELDAIKLATQNAIDKAIKSLEVIKSNIKYSVKSIDIQNINRYSPYPEMKSMAMDSSSMNIIDGGEREISATVRVVINYE